MRMLALFAGLTAILTRLNIGAATLFLFGDSVTQLVTTLAAAAISGAFVFWSRLGERCGSPAWVWITFGLCGLVIVASRHPMAWMPFGLEFRLTLFALSTWGWALPLAMLPLLLKIGHDLRARPGAGGG